MLTLLSALGSLLSFRVRSRLTLELELVAPRHQVTFNGTTMSGPHRFLSKDRCRSKRVPPAACNRMKQEGAEASLTHATA